jgi:hypothetical protein
MVAVAAAVAVASLGQDASSVAHARPIATLAASASPATPAGRAVRRDPGASLPDTVLARVGTTRSITRAEFLSHWRNAHRDAPPDSLTPASARKFLELLIDRELLAEAASQRAWVPTAEESFQLAALRDRMAMSLALDSLLQGSAGRSSESAARRGLVARDSVVNSLKPELDHALLERLTKAWAALPRLTADSSLAAQLRMMAVLPEVAAADTVRVIARSRAGDVQVHDVLEAWRRLPAVYRPRVETVDQMEDLVRNALFERVLRAKAADWGLARRPALQAVIDRQRENLAIARFLEQRIGRIEPDEPAIARWFEQHRGDYAIPTRVQVVRLAFDSRESAALMAGTLHDRVEAESLAARAERSGVPYRVRVSAASDSALFRVAMHSGPMAVVGPIRAGDEWVVARVEAVLPGRDRDLAEARVEAEARWTAEENERRLEALAAELARTTPVAVNEKAVRATATRRANLGTR